MVHSFVIRLASGKLGVRSRYSIFALIGSSYPIDLCTLSHYPKSAFVAFIRVPFYISKIQSRNCQTS